MPEGRVGRSHSVGTEPEQFPRATVAFAGAFSEGMAGSYAMRPFLTWDFEAMADSDCRRAIVLRKLTSKGGVAA